MLRTKFKKMKNIILRLFLLTIIGSMLTMLAYGFFIMPTNCRQCYLLLPIGTICFTLPICLFNMGQLLLLIKKIQGTFSIIFLTVIPAMVFLGIILNFYENDSGDDKIALSGAISNFILNILTSFFLIKYFKKYSL
jgi:hypothetical protein